MSKSFNVTFLQSFPDKSRFTKYFAAFQVNDTTDASPVAVEEKKAWMPNPRDGEHVFGVAHIFASFNDTFVVGFLLYFHKP